MLLKHSTYALVNDFKEFIVIIDLEQKHFHAIINISCFDESGIVHNLLDFIT